MTPIGLQLKLCRREYMTPRCSAVNLPTPIASPYGNCIHVSTFNCDVLTIYTNGFKFYQTSLLSSASTLHHPGFNVPLHMWFTILPIVGFIK